MDQRFNIEDLTIEQVAKVREQLDQELDHLSESYSQLRLAQSKFQSCRTSVKEASTAGKIGSDILVPLSATLYVPGKILDSDKYIVDIGTDYYVEKNAEGAAKFFSDKIENLNKNLVDLDRLVNEKMNSLQAVNEVFKRKYAETQKQQTKAASS